MTARAPIRTAFATAIATGALAFVAVVGTAAPAEAHDYLVSSTPAEGASLTELPDRFEVTMNEPMLDLGGQSGGFALQVRDADGLYYGDGCVTVDGATMSALPALGAAGAYSVLWQIVSADGHSVDGEILFTWAPTAADSATAGFASSGSTAPPVCGVDPSPNADSPAASEQPAPAAPAPSVAEGDGQSSDGQAGGEQVSDSPDAGSAPGAGILAAGGILLAAIGGAVVYLLVRRAKRS